MLACACAVAAASPLANRYIDLIENAVTGSLHDEAGRCIMGGDRYTCSATTGEDGKPVFAAYNSTLRLLGRDWPPYGHTMVGHMRLRNIRDLLQRVKQDKVEGDYVEMGVWRGGSCIYAKAVIDVELEQPERHVHLLDAFGLVKDYNHGKGSSFLAVERDQVRHNFEKYGLLDDRVHFHRGLFAETVPLFGAELRRQKRQIAVLRLDGNFYDTHLDAFYHLYELVPVGGFVIFDDGHHPEPKRAIVDFRRQQSIPSSEWQLLDVDGNAKYMRKVAPLVVDPSKRPSVAPSAPRPQVPHVQARRPHHHDHPGHKGR